MPQMTQLQAGGVPVYQMAGPGLDGGPVSSRPNGVAGGSASAGGGGLGVGGTGGGGRGSPGSPSMNSPQQPAPHAGPHQAQQPPPQGFQVHYALTPQGIVPMVPMMPNGAGGFANPALYPGLGGVYDDGRGGLAAMPPPPMGTGMDAGASIEKGRLSPGLPAGPSMHPRYPGSPPPPQQSHVQLPAGLQPLHAPAWSVGGGGVMEAGGPMGYSDGSGFNDGYRGISGPGGMPDGFRGGVGGVPARDARIVREGEAGKDVKDQRKRCGRCNVTADFNIACHAVVRLASMWRLVPRFV